MKTHKPLTVFTIAGLAMALGVASGFLYSSATSDRIVEVDQSDIPSLRTQATELETAHQVEVLIDDENLFVAVEQSMIGLPRLFSNAPRTTVFVWRNARD